MTRRNTTVLSLLLFALGCMPAPPRYMGSNKASAENQEDDARDSDNNTGKAPLSLTDCSEPPRDLYRLTRTEIANAVASALSLGEEERLSVRNAMPLDASKTGYENDQNATHVSTDLIFALSIALDKILSPEKMNKLLSCNGETDLNNSCVKNGLTNLAKKAYSASSTDDANVVSYLDSLKSFKTKANERLRMAVKSIFLSPYFLFNTTNKERVRAHLANTIWLDASGAGEDLLKLDDASFVKKLLADERSKNFAEAFLMHRLRLDDFDKNLNGQTEEQVRLRQSMSQETKLFIWDIFKSNEPVSTLLTAQSSFIDPVLAEHYGIPSVGEGFVKTSLPANRRGILTQASMLTLTSKPEETNIIARGLWIVEKVFCQHIPPAPSVEPIMEKPGEAPKTPREKLEAHRAKPECAACHAVFDPAGFALENFGPTGKWRESYANGLPVDTRAQFQDKTTTETPQEFFAYVESRKNDFSQCFSRELLTYVLRRELTSKDKCAQNALAEGFVSKNWGLETALKEILSWYEKEEAKK